MAFSPSILLVTAFIYLLPSIAAITTVYRAEDITPITLYGQSAVYLPQNCPQSFVFQRRARPLPELADDKIGIFPRDIIVDGKRCKGDALMLDFAPLGPTDHYSPQWVFEDSRFRGHPVNFTCGDNSFSIRFGYFNDVSTKDTGGFLRPEVVYFDFAVIPNTRPFAFCSYAGRRGDGKRPLDYAPFPTQRTWKKFHELRKLTHPTPPNTNSPQVSPMPEESMEAEATAEESDIDPGMNPDMNPNMNSNMNPSMNPDMNPNMNSNMNPSMNPGMNPGMNPDMNPNMNSNMNPGMNPNMNPNMNPGMNPDKDPGIDHDMDPDMDPGIDLDDLPTYD